MSTAKWYAVYTKPRWEKKVFSLLSDEGIIAYCPLNKVQRRWSDRMKIVHEPLFTSYVFVKIEEAQMRKVRMISGVVNFVYWDGSPAIIREQEIDTIKRFLNEYCFVRVDTVLRPRQRIRINNGVLMDNEGVVTRSEKNKVQVFLDSLGFRLTADLQTNEIRPV